MPPRQRKQQTSEVAVPTTTSSSSRNAASPLDKLPFSSFANNGVLLPSGHRITKRSLIASIPKYCFTRPIWKSFLFVGRDGLFIAAVVLAMRDAVLPFVASLSTHLHPALAWVLPAVAWVAYAIVQGTVCTGPWVIGHECGHGAFSASTALNDAVGFVIHSLLLVPYWSWQLTHAKHHKYTNHTTHGESHVPNLESEVVGFRALAASLGEDAFSAVNVVQHLLFGWPAYIVFNATGGRVNFRKEPLAEEGGGSISHFIAPGSQLYEPKQHAKVWLSTIGVVAMLGGLVMAAREYGALAVLQWYVGPYLVVNAWLVLYTWLQHTHEDIPHIGDDSYTWIRGALSTVDRPYPWIVDELHHHIGTTHVLHHLFSRVPHYHAQVASAAMKSELRGAYRHDPTPITVATFQTATKCVYIDGTEGVQYFKDASGCASDIAL